MRTEFQVWTHKELSVGQHFKLIKQSFKLVTLKKGESNHTAGKRFTCFLLKLKKLRSSLNIHNSLVISSFEMHPIDDKHLGE